MRYALKVLQEELADAEEYSLSVRDQDAYEYAFYQCTSLSEAIKLIKENS